MVRAAFVWAGLAAVACNDPQVLAPVTTDQACVALEGTEARNLMAAGYAMGAGPTVQAGSGKLVIDLPMSPATPTAFSGHVNWQVDTAGTYGIFRIESYPFLVRDSAEQILQFKRQAGVNADCERIGRVAFIDLAPGAYSLEFVPTDTPTATVALLPLSPQDSL